MDFVCYLSWLLFIAWNLCKITWGLVFILTFIWIGMQLQVHALMGFFCFVEEGMPIVWWVTYSKFYFFFSHFIIHSLNFVYPESFVVLSDSITWVCYSYFFFLCKAEPPVAYLACLHNGFLCVSMALAELIVFAISFATMNGRICHAHKKPPLDCRRFLFPVRRDFLIFISVFSFSIFKSKINIEKNH